MSALDNTLKIESQKNMYIKNTVGIEVEGDLLFEDDYKKFNKEEYLYFVVVFKVYKRRYVKVLEPIRKVGRNVETVIDEARKVKEKLQVEAKHGKYIDYIPTFEEMWQEYADEKIYMMEMTEKYKINNTLLYGKHMKKYIGNKRIDHIKADDFKGIRDRMIKQGLADSTVAQVPKVFGVLFKEAIIKGYITESPLDNVKYRKIKNARKFTLKDEDALKLYKTLMNYPDIKYRGIWMFLLEGRRKNEVLALTWDRVDLKAGIYEYGPLENKSGDDKEYILPQHIIDLLKQFPEPHEGLVFKSSRKAKDGTVGNKIDNFRKRWKGILKSLDINENVVPHDIRHWIGTVAVNAGIPLEHISFVLGQSGDEIAKRYSRVKSIIADKAVRQVHELIKNES